MKKVYLTDDCYLTLSHHPGSSDIMVHQFDEFYQDYRLLATLERGRWEFPNVDSRTKFFNLCKLYSGKIKRAMAKYSFTHKDDIEFNKTFTCFKRRFTLKIKRSLNKIKF
jgi:hypothetical protein